MRAKTSLPGAKERHPRRPVGAGRRSGPGTDMTKNHITVILENKRKIGYFDTFISMPPPFVGSTIALNNDLIIFLVNSLERR